MGKNHTRQSGWSHIRITKCLRGWAGASGLDCGAYSGLGLVRRLRGKVYQG